MIRNYSIRELDIYSIKSLAEICVESAKCEVIDFEKNRG